MGVNIVQEHVVVLYTGLEHAVGVNIGLEHVVRGKYWTGTCSAG